MGVCNVEIFRRKSVCCFPAELKPTEQARAGFDDKSKKKWKKDLFWKKYFRKMYQSLNRKELSRKKESFADSWAETHENRQRKSFIILKNLRRKISLQVCRKLNFNYFTLSAMDQPIMVSKCIFSTMIGHRPEVAPIRGRSQKQRIINRRVMYLGCSLPTDQQVRIIFKPTEWSFFEPII